MNLYVCVYALVNTRRLLLSVTIVSDYMQHTSSISYSLVSQLSSCPNHILYMEELTDLQYDIAMKIEARSQEPCDVRSAVETCIKPGIESGKNEIIIIIPLVSPSPPPPPHAIIPPLYSI